MQEKVKVLDRAKLRLDTLLQQEKSHGENRITDLRGEFLLHFKQATSLIHDLFHRRCFTKILRQKIRLTSKELRDALARTIEKSLGFCFQIT